MNILKVPFYFSSFSIEGNGRVGITIITRPEAAKKSLAMRKKWVRKLNLILHHMKLVPKRWHRQ